MKFVAASLTMCTVLLASAAHAETYRLVHAIGNEEQMVATDLSAAVCEERKREYKAVAERLGTYNERLGHGSVTCLPESLFTN